MMHFGDQKTVFYLPFPVVYSPALSHLFLTIHVNCSLYFHCIPSHCPCFPSLSLPL